MLKESGDKLDPAVKAEVETAVSKLKDAHKAADIAAIDAAIAELNAAATKMYQQAQAAQGGQQAGPQGGFNGAGGPFGGQQGGPQQPNNNGGDNIQDADFEEVK